jgi:PAS domain S-box-containing protein
VHKLLQRQLNRHYGGTNNIPDDLKDLMAAVSSAYSQADEDYLLLERAMDLTSEELLEKNASLQQEITDKKEAEYVIQRLTHNNQLLLDSAGEGIFGLDSEGIITFINPEGCRLLEYKKEELIGKNFSFILHPPTVSDDFSPYSKIDETLKKAKTLLSEDEIFWKKSGIKFPTAFTSTPMQDNDQLVGAVITFQDISNRKKFENTLKNINANLEDRVKKRTEELTRLAEMQEKEIVERRQIERALRSAKIEADKANLAKSDFLSRMSHELRTPMNAILGFGQLLQLDPSEKMSSIQSDRMDEILKAGRHLLDLINEILDLSRIEAGGTSLSLEPVKIINTLKDVLPLVQPMAEENGVRIINKIPASCDITVYVDATRVKQVFINLISNAIKYNKKNGTVTLELENAGEQSVKIHFRDNGLGISKEEQANIFDPFNRLGAENSVIEGTGIGLSITKQLIELMNGSITLSSTKDVGSCFTIELPLNNESIPSTKVLLDNARPKNTLQKEEEPSITTHSMDHIILYVEDNPINLRIIEQIIDQQNNIQLVSAGSAEEGIELAKQILPDIILMDINLPGMDGITACRKLKNFEETGDIPVIALSADIMRWNEKKSEAMQFHSFIAKPIDIDLFLDTIHSILNSKMHQS